MGDDPPYLIVGTEVSAKYKGAFCEAKIKKVVRLVKCKVTFKSGFGTKLLSDDQIKGTLRVGATVEAKHPDKNIYIEGSIGRIQDCSQYTVVFDDGDITTLRRTALCLKSGRHFNESETLDQLPLTHPEHFSNPVVGGRRGVRRKLTPSNDNDDSSDEEVTPTKSRGRGDKGADDDIRFRGKVICVEITDKKKSRDSWFPALIVTPPAHETVKTRTKDEYLVRSFRDGRYYTVPKKETSMFTKEHAKSESNSNIQKSAVEKALLFLEKNELPPHWDRDVLFAKQADDAAESAEEDAVSESEVSEEDIKSEEKDRFMADLHKYLEERSTPIGKMPVVCNKDLDLYKLYKVVCKNGGFNKVTTSSQWKLSTIKMGFGSMPSTSTINLVKQAYRKFLHNYEEHQRKLGCNLNLPVLTKSRSNRNLTRERHVSTSSSIGRKDESQEKEVKEDDEKDKASQASVTSGERDADTDSVVSDSDAKKSEMSDEPRRSRSRQDSRSNKKDLDDGSTEKSDATISKKIKTPKAKDPGDSSVSPAPTGRKSRGGSKYRRKESTKDAVTAVEVKTLPAEEGDRDSIDKNVKVQLGDKLRVYYPKADGKLYEAKVVDLDDKKLSYLVHYTGWNVRYDEWIPRSRICENLSLRLDQVVSPAQGRGPAPSNDGDTAGGITPKRSRAKKTRAAAESDLSSSATESQQGPPVAGPGRRRLNSESHPVSKRSTRRMTAHSAQSESDSSSDSDAKKEQENPATPSLDNENSSQPEELIAEDPTTEKPAVEMDTTEQGNVSNATSNPDERNQVIDLNQIRSEMKGLDNMVKVLPKPSSPSAQSEDKDKLDVYEFEDEPGETTPSLKMFSPRSPEKRETIIQKPNDSASLVVVSAAGLSSADEIPDSMESEPVLTFHAVTSCEGDNLVHDTLSSSEQLAASTSKQSGSSEQELFTVPLSFSKLNPPVGPGRLDSQSESYQEDADLTKITGSGTEDLAVSNEPKSLLQENSKLETLLVAPKAAESIQMKDLEVSTAIREPVQSFGQLKCPEQPSGNFINTMESSQIPPGMNQKLHAGFVSSSIGYHPIGMEKLNRREPVKQPGAGSPAKAKSRRGQTRDTKKPTTRGFDDLEQADKEKLAARSMKPKRSAPSSSQISSPTKRSISKANIELKPAAGLKTIAPSPAVAKVKQRDQNLPQFATMAPVTIGVHPPPPPLIPSSNITIPRESVQLPPVQALSQCFMPILTQRPMGQIVVASNSPLVIPSAPPLVLQPSFTPIVMSSATKDIPIASAATAVSKVPESQGMPRFGQITTAPQEKPLYSFNLAQCIGPGGDIRPAQMSEQTRQQYPGVQLPSNVSLGSNVNVAAVPIGSPPKKKQRRAVIKKKPESEGRSSEEGGKLKNTWKKQRDDGSKAAVGHQIRPKLMETADSRAPSTHPSILISPAITGMSSSNIPSIKLGAVLTMSPLNPAPLRGPGLKRKINEGHKILPRPKDRSETVVSKPKKINRNPAQFNINPKIQSLSDIGIRVDAGGGSPFLTANPPTPTSAYTPIQIPPVRFSVSHTQSTATVETYTHPVVTPLTKVQPLHISSTPFREFGKVDSKPEIGFTPIKYGEEKKVQLSNIVPPSFNLQIHERGSSKLISTASAASSSAVIVKEPSELGLPKIETTIPTLREEEESCNSLFCEEEIPGSPTGPDTSGFGMDDESARSNLCSPAVRSTATSPSTRDNTSRPQSGNKGSLDSFTDLTCGEEMKSEMEYLTSKASKSKDTEKSRSETIDPGLETSKCPAATKEIPDETSSSNEPTKLQDTHDEKCSHTSPATPESCSSLDSQNGITGRISPLIIEENAGDSKSKEASDNESIDGNATKENCEDESESSDTGKKGKDGPAAVRKSKSSDSKKPGSPPIKRRRISRRKSPDDVVRSYTSRGGRTCYSRRNVASIFSGNGSDCDSGRMPPPLPTFNLVRPPTTGRFNFIPDLDDVEDAEERISIILEKMQECRETHAALKAGLAVVERKRKRWKRREREKVVTGAALVRSAELSTLG